MTEIYDIDMDVYFPQEAIDKAVKDTEPIIERELSRLDDVDIINIIFGRLER